VTCYRPIPAFRVDGTVTLKNPGGDNELVPPDLHVPCGRCVGCLEKRAREWALRCSHEAQLHENNCFVTLTYGRNFLPPGGSLEHRDFQLFMKRTRKRLPVRFFMCGEYGPLNQRPHYHSILFGAAFNDGEPSGKSGSGEIFYDSPQLEKLWGYGRVSVQPVTPRTIAYCTRYCVDKFYGSETEMIDRYGYVDPESGEIYMRKPEYMECSKGVGHNWFKLYKDDVFPHDFCVFDGKEMPVPRYYNRKMGKDLRMDHIEFQREIAARKHLVDQSPERLTVREKVHKARVSRLKREFSE